MAATVETARPSPLAGWEDDKLMDVGTSIKRTHEGMAEIWTTLRRCIKEVAEKLAWAKQVVPRGEWGNWCQRRCGLGRQEVSNYLKIHKWRDQLSFGDDISLRSLLRKVKALEEDAKKEEEAKSEQLAVARAESRRERSPEQVINRRLAKTEKQTEPAQDEPTEDAFAEEHVETEIETNIKPMLEGIIRWAKNTATAAEESAGELKPHQDHYPRLRGAVDALYAICEECKTLTDTLKGV